MLAAFPGINDLPQQEQRLLMEGLVESAVSEKVVACQLLEACVTTLRNVLREVGLFWGRGEGG
jgi:hypothetical protein